MFSLEPRCARITRRGNGRSERRRHHDDRNDRRPTCNYTPNSYQRSDQGDRGVTRLSAPRTMTHGRGGSDTKLGALPKASQPSGSANLVAVQDPSKKPPTAPAVPPTEAPRKHPKNGTRQPMIPTNPDPMVVPLPALLSPAS